jgi:hypothetical protein
MGCAFCRGVDAEDSPDAEAKARNTVAELS